MCNFVRHTTPSQLFSFYSQIVFLLPNCTPRSYVAQHHEGIIPFLQSNNDDPRACASHKFARYKSVQTRHLAVHKHTKTSYERVSADEKDEKITFQFLSHSRRKHQTREWAARKFDSHRNCTVHCLQLAPYFLSSTRIPDCHATRVA